ncbi:hypothetical protein HAP93_04400 [Acidithiobacillus ferriphilus]|uniref:hypothetical protein n=1 Tax=Acidithiobacillus ferriphilus TaxID=1689834 RepID=UPI001C060E78|nr:hypothetical protein [Acidithiobacillus ferriphilus]MBU2785013.1 hypothetical protein [Acidithiobacillus ferriphilus]
MTHNETSMRKLFRNADALGDKKTTNVLSQARATRPPQEYAAIIKSLRTAAPKSSLALYALGPRSTSELIWNRNALLPLPLENELHWAKHWLTAQAIRINSFRRIAAELQKLVLAGNLNNAKEQLDKYVEFSGWSLWAVELRAAFLQLADGTEAQRAWLHELQSKAINTIPGLLFHIFADRNDDTFSFDAIVGKCKNSFPRLDAIAPWLVDYLNYRALSYVDNPMQSFPRILSRDISSSLIDYYESVIELLGYIENEKQLTSLRPVARQLISYLLDNGYQDHRLNKLSVALQEISPISPISTEIHELPSEPYRAFYPGYIEHSYLNLPDDIASNLRICENKGAPAYDLLGKMLKWGLNLRGLDIGPAVAGYAFWVTSDVFDNRSLPISVALLTGSTCVDDIAAFSEEIGQRLIQNHLSHLGRCVDDEQLLKPSRWGFQNALPIVGPVYLWLANFLLAAQQFDELSRLTGFLRYKSQYWERQCAKFDLAAFARQDRFDEAIKLLTDWFLRDYRYAREFPTSLIFSGRKWNSFSRLDLIKVGLVAHYTFEAKGSDGVGYICKMACRKFLQNGMRKNIVKTYAAASKLRKAQIVAFLRDVWIEQNMALCHQFESTAQVRSERMSVLQLLLGWDKERTAEYAEAIKELTLIQTLQQGLERIDQTRIFVNESAITRWAEKEIEQDYERWKKLGKPNTDGGAVDELLRMYALDPENIQILKDFADGRPTDADALFIDVIDRFFKRFLLDPTDGLDAYLSVRIRHGSFRGTILGPLEEQGLLYSTTGFSREAFETRWSDVLRLQDADKTLLLSTVQEFSYDIRKIVDDFVNQRIQVRSSEKPDGAFAQIVSPIFAKIFAASFAEQPPTFQAFLASGYFIFWKLIEIGLADLRQYVTETLAIALHNRVDTLINDLRFLEIYSLPLITTLTTVSTMTKSQCDTVAEWFQLPSEVAGEKYQLGSAIQIASAFTRNVHRAFNADIILRSVPDAPLFLTTSALAVLMDCLFVIFENAWKHSGLTVELPPIEVSIEFFSEHRLLTLAVYSELSFDRRQELLDGELDGLCKKYLGELPLELISLEGGSGFPKLARLTRSVPRFACPLPFDFGIVNGKWFTRLTVPLYEREGAYEAYE